MECKWTILHFLCTIFVCEQENKKTTMATTEVFQDWDTPYDTVSMTRKTTKKTTTTTTKTTRDEVKSLEHWQLVSINIALVNIYITYYWVTNCLIVNENLTNGYSIGSLSKVICQVRKTLFSNAFRNVNNLTNFSSTMFLFIFKTRQQMS